MLSSQDEFRRSSRQQQMVNIGLLGRPVVVVIAAAVDDDDIIDVVAAVSDSLRCRWRCCCYCCGW